MTLVGQIIGYETGDWVILTIPDYDAIFFLVLLLNGQLSLLDFLVEELFGPDDGLSSIIDENVKFSDVFLDIVDQRLDLFLREKITL